MRFTLPHTDKSTASGYFNQFDHWLGKYTQTITAKAGESLTWLYHQISDKPQMDFYDHMVFGRKVSAEEWDFFLETQQETGYREYQQWRSVIVSEVQQLKVQLLEGKKLPADLRAYLAANLQQLQLNIISPLYYQKLLTKLENSLAKSALFSFYKEIIAEAKENLRAALKEQPAAVFHYFYNDVTNHTIEMAKRRYSLQKLLKQLNYYQDLVPANIYLSVRQSFEQAFATELNYQSLQKKLNQIFAKEMRQEVAGVETSQLPTEPSVLEMIKEPLRTGWNYLKTYPNTVLFSAVGTVLGASTAAYLLSQEGVAGTAPLV